MSRVGIISPGAMGTTLAKSLIDSGHQVFWASDFRSQTTKQNANSIDMVDLQDTEKLFATCNFVFCIGRNGWGHPDRENIAGAHAQQAVDLNFEGIYVDFNGLEEDDIEFLNHIIKKSNVKYVEAALRGWPHTINMQVPEPGTISYDLYEPRTMFLAGEYASDVESLFSDEVWVVKICETSPKSIVLGIAKNQPPVERIEN